MTRIWKTFSCSTMRKLSAKSTKTRRLAALWSSFAVGYAVLVVVIFPSFEGTDHIDQLLEAFPPFIRSLIGSHVQPISSLNGFLTMEFFSWFPLLGGFFAIAFCSSALARELETHSVELLLSQSVPRTHVVLRKYAAFSLAALFLVFSTFAFLLASVGYMDLGGEADIQGYLAVALQTLFIVLALGSMSLWVSSLSSEQRKAMGVATGIALFMFFLHALSGMNTVLRQIDRVSLFHYFDASTILKLGQPQWMNMLHLSSFSLFFLLAAVFTFDRRDIPA